MTTKPLFRLVIGAALTVKGSLYYATHEDPLMWDLLRRFQCVRSLGRIGSLINGYLREIWSVLQWFNLCMTECRTSCFL
jgi:hypothetical protein